MNLLVIDQFSEPGGAQLCLRDLMPAMVDRGWNVRLMVPGVGPLTQAAAGYGVAAHELPIARYSNGRKSARDLLRFGFDLQQAAAAIHRLVQEHKTDLILVNGPRALPATSGAGVPTVFYAHSVLRKRYARRLVSWSLRRSKATVLAASQHVVQSLAGLYPVERVRVIYTGVRDHRLPGKGRNAGPLRIGMVGRIAPEKGHDDFIAAAAKVLERNGEVRFVVYGAALFSESAYEQRIRRLAGVLPVEFPGWVNDAANAFGQLDVVAVPSAADEAAPRVLLEGLSAGLPIVAYPSGGIPEIVENGRSGILAGPGAEPLAEAMITLVDQPDLRAALSAGARRTWEDRFTLERYQSEVCGFLEAAAQPWAAGNQRSAVSTVAES